MSENNPGASSRDIRPLALDAWNKDGENTYSRVLDTVKSEVEHIDDDLLRGFALDVLYGKIAHDAQRNADNLTRYEKKQGNISSLDQAMIAGMGTPAEHVRFLAQNPDLKTIEVARRTHVSEWDSRKAIDVAVRTSLDEAADLSTVPDKDEQRYKIRQFGTYDKHPLVFVDRKRTVRSHLGGSVLTIVKNSILLNGRDETMMSEHPELYEYLAEEYMAFAHGDYDYDARSQEIHDHVEPHMQKRNINKKPSWAIPVGTTYYAKIKRD